MISKLKKSFYNRHSLKVGKDLIGKYLVHKRKDEVIEGEIVQTEAYHGFDDKACHGSNGKTERNKAMFKEGGFAYVYIIYGIHHCLNLTTFKSSYPSAVLIREVDFKGADGPGKLCKKFKIKKETHNGISILGDKLWVEDRGEEPDVKRKKRIGIDYAEESAKWPWRFVKK